MRPVGRVAELGSLGIGALREGFCSFGLQAGVGVVEDFDRHGESMTFRSTDHLERGTSSSFPDFSSSAVLSCRTLFMPNHALQRTRRERRGCSRCVPSAGSLSLGRWT